MYYGRLPNKQQGGDKKMVTVMLLGCSDGSKARPTIVNKGKGYSKEDKVLKEREDILILFSSNRLMKLKTTAQFHRKFNISPRLGLLKMSHLSSDYGDNER